MRPPEAQMTTTTAQISKNSPNKSRSVTCWKCGGSGNLPHYRHIDNGVCYPCKGHGVIEYIAGEPIALRASRATKGVLAAKIVKFELRGTFIRAVIERHEGGMFAFVQYNSNGPMRSFFRIVGSGSDRQIIVEDMCDRHFFDFGEEDLTTMLSGALR